MADTRITDAEIAGHMGWRGPAAYTDASLRKIRGIVDHVLRAERAAVSEMHEKDLRDVFNLAWDQALSDAAFYADSHCGVDEHHLEHMLELVPPKLRVRGAEIASRPAEVDDETRTQSKIAWARDQMGNVSVKAFISVEDVERLNEDPVARMLMRKPEQTGSDVCLLMESVFHRSEPSHTTNKEK